MALIDKLVAYYKLDETSGNASDSVGTNTLTNNNTVAYSTGKIIRGADGGSSNTNKSLSRDGNTPVGITYNQFATAWSISFWVNTTTSGANKVITGMQVQSGSSRRRNMYLANDSGTLKVKVFDGSANTYTTSQSMSTGTWYNVILTYNGSTINVYVNNSNVLSQSRSLSFQGDAQAGGFGILCERQNNGSFNLFSGLVDEVAVFDEVIDSTDRAQLYNSGLAKQFPFSNSNILYGNKTDEIQFPSFSFNNDGPLLVAVLSSTSAPTGCTFNGDAMTHFSSLSTSARSRTQRVYFLNNADIGNYTFAVTGGSDHYVKLFSVVSGYDTSNPLIDGTSGTGTSTTPSLAVTTTIANSDVFAAGTVGDSATAGTNTYSYAGGTQPFVNFWWYTASTTATGSKTLNMNSTNEQFGLIGFSVKPEVTTTIKTWDGVANANIKTLMGVAKANVKTINGIT